MPIVLLTLLLAFGGADGTGSVAAPRPLSSVAGPASTGVAVTGGGAAATESKDREAITNVVQQHSGDLKACYDPQVAKQPDLLGRITVQFTIASGGTVIAAAMQNSTMGSPPVEDCIVNSVRTWKFPKRLGAGVVSYPFVFIPGGPIPVLAGADGAGAVACTFLDPELIVHRSTNGQGIPANGVIAVIDHGLLLVDTAWTEPETEALLKWGETHLGRPWLGAIITHEHADRDGGLGALQRRHVSIAALDLTVAKLEKRGVRGVTTLFTAKAGAFQDARGFEALYPGPGHTSDNIVVKFRQALFGGCLIKAANAPDLGFTGDADLASWPASVRRVAARYPKVQVIPGHGPIDPAGASYQHTLDLLAGSRGSSSGGR